MGLQLHAPVEIPQGLVFYGIDSQQRHSVAGNDYGTVRAAAFIGLQMLARIQAGKQASTSGMFRCLASLHVGTSGCDAACCTFSEGCPTVNLTRHLLPSHGRHTGMAHALEAHASLRACCTWMG